MGLRCPREPSPRIWTRNADKVRFWTENADMFGAPFTAVGFFDRAANRRTSRVRSCAYAHSMKLHGLSIALTFWTGTADVDRLPRVPCQPF
jgi:hypothetical protein